MLTKNLINNGSFENGWRTLPPNPGTNTQNHEPVGWTLDVVQPGAYLYASRDQATGYPECVVKPCSVLPPDECEGGKNALILDGTNVYKIFSAEDAYGATLSQHVKTVENFLGYPYTLLVPVNIHNQHNNQDPWGAEVFIGVNGNGFWTQIAEFTDRTYMTLMATGILTRPEALIEIKVKSKWEQGIDFFMDDISFTIEMDPEEKPKAKHVLKDAFANLVEKVS